MSTAAHPATIAPDTAAFYIPKGRVRVMLLACIAMQKRDDLSGKFAKKLGRIRRALTTADEEVVAQQNDVLEAFTLKADGKPVPVYAETEDGKPIFGKDDKGNDTDVRVVVPGRFQLTDQKAYGEALKELAKEVVVVRCPAFRSAGDAVPELELFKAVRGEIIDALQDLEEDSPLTKSPLELVKDTAPAAAASPVAEADAAEDRGAP